MNKALGLVSALGFALLIPTASIADDAHIAAAARSGKVASVATTRAVNNQTAVACNLCFTCGGDWPVFAGSIRSRGDTPTERGSSCSGALASRADTSPFLCCR